MLKVQSNNGKVDIFGMDGTVDELISNLGSTAHKVMLLMANDGSKSKEEVYFKYGLFAKQLVDYISTTVQRIDEIE